MRHPLIILLICYSWLLPAQLTDDFSDGDFTNNPTWQGQTSKFQVVTEALQLNNAATADEAYLSVPALTRDSTTWSFRVKLDFSPSANNRVRFYLKANTTDLLAPLEGYFIQIGETGSQDGVDLYRQDGSTITRIIDGTAGTAFDRPDFVVDVIRTKAGEWLLWIDSIGSGNPKLQGQVIDTTYAMGTAVGVWCKHTSSNNTAFTFDDIWVDPLFVDTIPPELRAVQVIDSETLRVHFDENLDPVSALDPAHYTVSKGIGVPSSVSIDANDSAKVELTLSIPLASPVQYDLSIQNIADANGNVSVLDTIAFTYYIPAPGDIRVNEFMADPSPPRGWPEAEFIELYNRLSIPVPLTGWTIADGSTTVPLPMVTIPAQGYLLLVDEANTTLFPASLPLLALDPLPSLNNSGDVILLSTPNGEMIDRIDYTADWYANPDKEDGGWSLELLDADRNCPGRTNWRASIDPTGATPGAINSWIGRFIDTIPPQLLTASILDPNTITVTFSEAVDTNTFSFGNLSLSPGIGNPISWQWQGVSQEVLQLSFSVPMDTGQLYQLMITGISDCRGNSLTEPLAETLLIPLPLAKGDLVVNEVLFNPRSGEVDYVEVFNRSEKQILLDGLLLEELDAIGMPVDDVQVQAPMILAPGDFAALTSDRDIVLLAYTTPNPEGVLTINALPNFPDDEGGVRLMSKQGLTIDSMHYSEDWHFGLIDDLNGVSLERIDPEASSTARENWYSASSTVGYGTPAYRNSQFQQMSPFEGVIKIDPETVSPDGDGYQDQLVIAYAFTEPGYVGTVQVLDSRGRLIRFLLRSGLLEQTGTLLWDGLTVEGRKADPGIYVIYFEVFNLQGDVKRYKHRCVVAERW